MKAYPLFSNVSSEEINSISNMFYALSFGKGDVIINEGDLVDSVYFIAEGKVEVRQMQPDSNENIPIAALAPNEPIGLNYTGFYSSTAKRSASVVALTDGVLYGINLNELNQFIAKQPEFQQGLKQYSQILLRMGFIKKVAPFTELTVDELFYYVKHIDEIIVPAGEIIFKQGEEGKTCYLICHGKVEILILNTLNQLEPISVLESPAIFGETAIFMRAPRNATVRAVTNCHLLVVNQSLLTEMLHKKSVSESITNIIMRRSRPNPAKDIEAYKTKFADGDEIYVLKNPHEEKYCRLTKEGWFIWQQLDGKKSVRDITNAYFNQYHIFNPELVSNVIHELERLKFITLQENIRGKKDLQLSWWLKAFINLRKIMEIKYAYKHVDPLITKLYSGGVCLLYKKWVQIFLMLLSIVGFGAFCIQFSTGVALMQAVGNVKWELFAVAIPAGIMIVILHEVAHAMTAKFYGQKVNSFGFGWVWFGPVAFCDTSDMWLCSRWPRVIVDLAGIYAQMILAAISVILGMLLHSPELRLFLWYYSLFNYLLIHWNLTPLFDFDGYYTLMDWLDEPNLRSKSITWLIDTLPKQYKQMNFLRKSKNEIIYWLACLLFLVLEFIFPFFILKYLLAGLLGVSNPFYSFALASFAVVLSMIAIWFEIKKTKMKSSPNNMNLF